MNYSDIIYFEGEPRLEKSVPEMGDWLADAGDDTGEINEPTSWVEIEDLVDEGSTLDLHVLEGGVDANSEEFIANTYAMLHSALHTSIEGVELLITVDQMLQAKEHADLQVLVDDLEPTEARILDQLIKALHARIDSEIAYRVLFNHYADVIHQAETVEAANQAYETAIAMLTPPPADAQYLGQLCLEAKEWIVEQEKEARYLKYYEFVEHQITLADTVKDANAVWLCYCEGPNCQLTIADRQYLGKVCYDRKDELRGYKAYDAERQLQAEIRQEIRAREQQIRDAEPVTIVAVVKPREHINVPMVIGTGKHKRLRTAFDEREYQRMLTQGWTEYHR